MKYPFVQVEASEIREDEGDAVVHVAKFACCSIPRPRQVRAEETLCEAAFAPSKKSNQVTFAAPYVRRDHFHVAVCAATHRHHTGKLQPSVTEFSMSDQRPCCSSAPFMCILCLRTRFYVVFMCNKALESYSRIDGAPGVGFTPDAQVVEYISPLPAEIAPHQRHQSTQCGKYHVKQLCVASNSFDS